ncbi:NAD(P)-binding protein [Neurospora crassa]|uniref:NAD(P)-binding protein n=1 Tax=Neurospora crassa (strain ATCC 24698 / 74-OR23-1A / CBS 708.71 / DSM 1257 / FGSC 987) TaxID=367110 RepID=Q7SC47_NEUCR|nr:hypothetical protein NCU08406 [Neurospora crassa OR74A]EAA34042.1 hypothetical protein NCU08406 [Neurospora crassa OR74A]KHE82386.1 NAD(P)-binding protein [Neurospora crassa]|eukprot:XP_963278.1 hypothetical protein NCU08406 [Neurospora crassa OR74A]
MATPTKASSKFNVTPEQQASLPHFFYQQLTCKPKPVTGANLNGKTAIVTGSNTGIGLETARQLLDLGASKLILAVRNETKGATAAANLTKGLRDAKQQARTSTVEVWNLDLSVYKSILAFCARAEKELSTLDIAVLNAGIGPAARCFNPHTGHDEVIQVNYLSTALLAILLLPVIQSKRQHQSGPGRMTIVNSEVSGWTDFTEVMGESRNKPGRLPASILAALDADDKDGKPVDMVDRMFVSKLLGQFFLFEIAKVVDPSLAIINATSPSWVLETEFNRDREGSSVLFKIGKFVLSRVVANTAAVGARMVTDAAVNHGEETHGEMLSFQQLVP